MKLTSEQKARLDPSSVAIVATVATVVTAGAFALGMGATGSLFSVGLSALGGAITGTAGAAGIGSVLSVGLAAGFIGSIAGQTAANLIGMQSGIDFGGALISGIATAATAGIGYGLKNIGTLQNLSNKIGKYDYKYFSTSSAFEMMEQNAASQAFNTTIRRHQHFDWTELGVATLTGGLMGSKAGENLSKKLENLDNHTGMLRAELQTLAGAGAQSLTTGSHFDALQVLGDNFGSTIGNAVVGRFAWSGLEDRGKDIAKENIKGLTIDGLLDDFEQSTQDFNNYLANPIDEGINSPIGTPSSPRSQDGDIYLSGSILSGYTGDVIYNNSEHFDGNGAFAHESVPFRAKEVSSRQDATTYLSGSVLSGYVGHVIYNDSELFDGSGLFVHEAMPLDLKKGPLVQSSSHLEKSKLAPKDFGVEDAKNGLRKVFDEYGFEMSKIVEKMYRYETKHFSSGQYILTGAAGMEAVKGAKAPYYGWSNEFFMKYPEYTPVGTTELHDGIGASKKGANAQKKGLTPYIIFPSVEAGMMHLAYKIKNQYNGDYARWHSSLASHKQVYRNELKGVRWSMTDEFQKGHK
ncbi:MAG: hypothetical protein P4L79_17210 [Legionella sp.]|uniref:hypothetical protein n=1 Tax=Legionella sp. TaxID=459 RepID=UPI00284796C2|nr:hypothetical protein [Legionella sp.]